MPRKPKKSKAQRIRELLAQGVKPKTIARRVGTTKVYVGQVRWNDERRAKTTKKRVERRTLKAARLAA